MPMLSAAVVIIHDDQVLLIKRADFDVWCLPGGAVDPGESVAQAAIREAREETGLEVQLTRLVGIYSRPRWNNGGNHLVIFAGVPVGGELRPSCSEALEVRYFDPRELPDTLIWWHRQHIQDVFDGVGGSVAWVQGAIWPFEQTTSRQELYAMCERAGMSRLEFYEHYLAHHEPEETRLEVDGIRDTVPAGELWELRSE